MQDHELLRRIILNSGITIGKPVIKGTEITVEHILGSLAHGTSEEQLFHQEGVSREDIQACLLFAAKSLETSFFMPLAVRGAV